MRLLSLVLLNVWFYSLYLAASALVIGALSAAFTLIGPFGTWRQSLRRIRRGISYYGKITARLPYPFIRLKWTDEAGVQWGKPYIFVCNHRSTIDAFLLCELPVEAVEVVNTWPFRIPVLGFFAKMAGYLSVNTLPTDEFFYRAKELLGQGVSVIFFPEGTRSRTREMGNFRSAAFRLFLETKVPIVPICMAGNEKVMQRGSLTVHPGVVQVKALAQIHWKDNEGATPYTLKNKVREIMARELVRMDGEG